MRNFLAILLCCGLSASASAQMTDSLYGEYRERLLNNFVHTGPGPGNSIPAAAYWPAVSCETAWLMTHACYGNGLVKGASGILEWTDGTTHLGHYIAVLATEYARLHRRGKDVSETVRQLSMAIGSLVRLDTAAELRYELPASRNGLFIRDDVPGTIAHAFSETGCIKSWSVCGGAIREGNLMSQDQLIHLMFGAAFVNKLIPDSVLSTQSKISLKKELNGQLQLSLKYIRKKGWIIQDPHGTPVKLGYSAIGYSYGIVKAMRKMTGNGSGNAASLFAGRPLWTTLLETSYQQDNPLHNEVNLAMQLCLMSISGQHDQALFTGLCTRGNMELYLLADMLLHDKSPYIDPGIFSSMLETVPAKGPCNQSYGCENATGWMSENRWFHPDSRNGNRNTEGSAYNGLDAMLLYNLYILVFEKD